MGLFDRLKTTAGGLGHTIASGMGQATDKAKVEVKEAAKIAAVKADINVVNSEIEACYAIIGKAYVDAAINGADLPDLGCRETLTLLEPKLVKKAALEKELIELEKALQDSQILQERQAVQREINEVKAKLDKAKAMGAMSDAEYEARLAKEMKKLDHFEAIRNLKKQYELEIISKEELDIRVANLLN